MSRRVTFKEFSLFLPWQQRDALPHVPAVYAFTTASGSLLYIGATKNLWYRMRNHGRAKMLPDGAVIRWHETTGLDAFRLESDLIKAFDPPWNGTSTEPEVIRRPGGIRCFLGRIVEDNNRRVRAGEPGWRITQRVLAKDTHIPLGTIRALYTSTARRVDLAHVEILCRYLRVGVGDLFALEAEPAPVAQGSEPESVVSEPGT